MSTPEDIDQDGYNTNGQPSHAVKKRRVQTLRACDRCRLKKIRCDGMPTPGSRCSHCVAAESTCVFTQGIKKRAPAKKYVDGLESRLERLEGLLARLHPDNDFSHELDVDGPLPHAPAHEIDPRNPRRSMSDSSAHSLLPPPMFDDDDDDPNDDPLSLPDHDQGSDDEDDDVSTINVAQKLRDMQLRITGPVHRYYGKSSSIRLLRTALTVKQKYTGGTAEGQAALMDNVMANAERRPDFWKSHPWELDRFSTNRTAFVFPDPDLMHTLIDIYFSHTHAICPVLHRPTFERQVAEQQHLSDDGFGAVVLLVCSLGGRLYDDPRVLLDDPEKPSHPHSAGWKWFNQVQLIRNHALADPLLVDVQAITLSVIFLSGASPPQACWNLTGLGIRMAQDAGAHMRKTYPGRTMEAELWKRVFWALVTLDIWFSSFLGRPVAVALDNFDVELPAECDDEYWEMEDSTLSFKQPANIPARSTYFIFWIKLHIIHLHALQTIYGLERHKVIAKIGKQEWERRVVTELDSALNNWFDSLPDHLRWDPTRESDTLFLQTVCLHSAYNLVQIIIHRPFIPSSRKTSSLSFPSLTICANSARACTHVLEAHRLRMPQFTLMNLLLPAFMSGIVLLLGIWCAKRAGLHIDAQKEMRDLSSIIKYVSAFERRWPMAGKFKDLLTNLSAMGDIPLPESPPALPKRDREDDDKQTSQPQRWFPPSSGLAPAAAEAASRKISGRRKFFPATKTEPSELDTFGPPIDRQNASHSNVGQDSVAFNAGGLAPAFGSGVPFPPFSASGLTGNSNAPYKFGGSSGLRHAPEFPLASAMSQHGTLYQSTGPASQANAYEATMPTSGTALGADIRAPVPTDPYGASSYGAQYFTTSPQQQRQQPPQDLSGGQGADELMKMFESMAPHDGEMGVGSDSVAMWSTMPANFQSEDWENYVSNIMGMTNSTPAASQVPPLQNFNF